MALFSVNQNVQWFTAKTTPVFSTSVDYKIGDQVEYSDGKYYEFTSDHAQGDWDTDDVKEIPTPIGTTIVKGDYNTDSQTELDSSKVYLVYESGKGPKRSEVIEKVNHGYITFTKAVNKKLNASKITLNSSVSSTPIVGQTYGVAVRVPNYQAISDYAVETFTATVIAKDNVAAHLYRDLASALYNTVSDVFDVYTIATNTYTKVVAELPDTDTTSYTGIQIKEIEQKWNQGTMQRERVNFTIDFAPITVNGVEFSNWATAVDDTANNYTLISNSKDIADMEWFYLGEHGDQQRMVGYPNVVMHDDNYYLVNSNNADGYDLIRIHHSYIGSNHAVQKSEKDILIACSASNSHAVATDILTQLDGFFIDDTSTSWSASADFKFTF